MIHDKHLIARLKASGLTKKETDIALSRFEERKINRKTILLRAGEIASEAYFIVKGCLRVYYDKGGVEISAYFFTENMFTNACESFIGQKPSRHFIEAVEDCVVFSITYSDLQSLYIRFPKVNMFFRMIMEERFEAIHHSFTSQILESPRERYLNLVKHDPTLVNRIPQHQIATLLGITPVSLSRIRSRIRKKS